MKTKTYGIKFLFASSSQKKMFNRKQLATQIFIPYVLAFILILKVYKQGVFVLEFHI